MTVSPKPADTPKPSPAEPVHLLLGADEAYAMPMAVAAHSALSHLDPRRKVVVVILDGGISETSRATAMRLLQGAHPQAEIRWRIAELTGFADINVRHYSGASLIRLLMPSLFDEHVTRVLYLDSDLVVTDDVSSLWAMDLCGKAVWAVQNGADHEFDDNIRKKFPGIDASPDARYFNSGVLLVNLPEWRAQDLTARVLAFLHESSDMLSFPDQDALNAIVAGDWGRLPARWNKQANQTLAPGVASLHEPGILHFTTHKPWKSDYAGPERAIFHRAWLRSGWKSGLAARREVTWLTASQIYFRNRARIRRRLGLT